MSMPELLKFSSKIKFRNPTIVVVWGTDAGQIGPGVADYLNKELHGQPFCEIEPADFFALDGVAIENDMITFPESKFYAFPEHNLIVFSSAIPRFEWFRFLNLILDVGLENFRTRELFTVGGMISNNAHTEPREPWASFSSPQIKRALNHYELSRETDYETPAGGRPTLSAFLLWAAKQRNLKGANLWVPVPFYLVSSNDPQGQKKVLEFLDGKLDLGLDYHHIDTEIERQNQKIARLRLQNTEVDRIINKLESNLRLTEEEHDQLAKEMDDYLRHSH